MRIAITLVAFLLCAGEAYAANETVRLVYTRSGAAVTCPDASALRTATIGYLGRDPFSDEGALTLTCDVSGDAEALELAIAITGRDGARRGARTLRAASDDCPGLLDAAALAIAIALQPGAPAAGLNEDPPADGATETEAAGTADDVDAEDANDDDAPASAVLRRSPPTAAVGTRGELGAGALASAGLSPTPLAGLALGLGARFGAWSGTAELRALLPATATLASTMRVDVWRVELVLAPCVLRGHLAGCALLQLGVLHVSPREFDMPRSVIAPTVAAGGRVAWRLPAVAGLDLAVHADLALALTQTTLTENGVAVWRQPVASVALGITAIIALP